MSTPIERYNRNLSATAQELNNLVARKYTEADKKLDTMLVELMHSLEQLNSVEAPKAETLDNLLEAIDEIRDAREDACEIVTADMQGEVDELFDVIGRWNRETI